MRERGRERFYRLGYADLKIRMAYASQRDIGTHEIRIRAKRPKLQHRELEAINPRFCPSL